MSPASVLSGGDFSNDRNEMPLVPRRKGSGLEGVVERNADADCGLTEVVVNHALAVA